jgi:hypothetical protein
LEFQSSKKPLSNILMIFDGSEDDDGFAELA